MILADKIIQLRKQFGWSQENLADALNVSRQSVSKWESGNSIPDLTKILKMAEIFGVSTDYLLKDEIEIPDATGADDDEGLVKLSLEEANHYVSEKEKSIKMVARGVLLCIYAVIPLLILLGLSKGEGAFVSHNVALLVGLTLILLIAAIGVSLFIISNQFNLSVEKLEAQFELSYGVEGVYKDKLAKYKPKYNRGIAIAIIMMITSAVPLIYASVLSSSATLKLMMVVVLILLAGFALYRLILVNATKNAYEVILKTGEFTPTRIKENKKIGLLAVVFWPIVVAIYLYWSFWLNAWYISWLIWPIAGLVFAALAGLVQILFPVNKEK